jgi:thiamine biosynthesis lipoprotein
MSAQLGRRRLLITATAGGLALLAGDARAIRAATWRWQGAALGADSTILLAHSNRAAARQAIAACRAEITRLEQIFSLYRADSALSQLNRQGQLESPPLELVELLAFSNRVSAATGGAFDVTVQPLWDLYAGHFAHPAANPAGPDDAALAATLARVDWRAIEIDSTLIGFRRRGMAVTLNGVAQGYITDRVADLLRGRGFENVLVELGEIRALGRNADSDPWRAGIANPNDPSAVLLELPLPDVALATSGGYGAWFDPAHRHHHIFDPVTGRSANRQAAVSVTASRAMVADILSTVLMIISADAGRRLLVTFGPATAYLFALDGARTIIRG